MKLRRVVVRKLADISLARRLARSIGWEVERREARVACGFLSPTSTVLRGPFAGMIYPVLDSPGSALVPKLLGSYEDELHDVLASTLQAGPRSVVNIGCGEGYYAVGLARAVPGSTVIAVDLDAGALELCRRMAAANGVADRVHRHRAAPEGDLDQGWPSAPDLLVCDCEGCEERLAETKLVARLVKATVLVELHDDDFGPELARCYESTHRARWIESRLKHLDEYPETSKLPLALRRDALLTERTRRQRWLVLTPLR